MRKSIIETEFVKKHPEHVAEMQQEMKFANLEQGDAEKKIAQKYNLPILSKLVSSSSTGRWVKMLKIAAPVTSTTAGLESRPRFGRKKKKKLLKAEKKKAGRVVNVRNVSFVQELPVSVEDIKKDYDLWVSECKGKSLGDLGITGRGHSEGGSVEDLYTMIERHGEASTKRPNQSGGRGVGIYINALNSLLNSSEPLTETDEKNIVTYVADIKKLSGGKMDPRNIRFTLPKIIEKKPDGKYAPSGKQEYFGHYRTPIYLEHREKVKEETETMPAVDSSWYATARDTAKPPLWQAIFLGSSVDEGGKPKTVVSKGLLAVLEGFSESMGGATIESLIIRDRGKMGERIEDLKKVRPIISEIGKIMRDDASYRKGSGKLLYVGARGILTRLSDKFFKAGPETSEYLEKIAGLTNDEILGMDNIDSFKIEFTKAGIDNLINETYRGNNLKAPNGHYIILTTDTASKLRQYAWAGDIKKSWIELLWS